MIVEQRGLADTIGEARVGKSSSVPLIGSDFAAMEVGFGRKRSRRKGRQVGAAGASLAMAVSLLAAAPASATVASCTSASYRAFDFVGVSSPNSGGVNSQLYVPPLSALGNYSTYPTGGDIYVTSDGGPAQDFVQMGWSTHNGQTMIWWKEKSPYQQEFGPSPTLPISTGYHNFRILRDSIGFYNFFVDGNYVGQSSHGHPTGAPSVTGEQNNSCGKMDNLAVRSPSPPYGTLWYYTDTGGWLFWSNDLRNVNPLGTTEYTSTGVPYNSTVGTDFAYGGPS